jgi:hypothetical protein
MDLLRMIKSKEDEMGGADEKYVQKFGREA